MIDNSQKKVCFPVNEHNWILVFQKLGKVTIRASKIKDKGRKSDETTQHRMFELECEGGVKIKSKLYDTSDFFE